MDVLSIQRIAVIGAGHAGRSFALRCVRAGLSVILEDVLPSKLRLAEDLFATESAGEASMLRLATTVEEAVRYADLSVDFVPDELESKLEIFSMLDRMSPARTILCTPTSCLSLTDLASCTYRSERCVGLKGSLVGTHVSVIHGRLTAPAIVDATSAWLRDLGYDVGLVDDVEEPMLVKNSFRLP